jgi:hypothetical protein
VQGLIFVTWEKYLTERFGEGLLSKYRDAIGETPTSTPLYSHVYSDEILLAGVGAASKLTGLPADTLLREYGRYFIINGLTRHLCAYLLSKVQSGRDLLLTMRDAHAQMRRTPDALTPPLFEYEALSSNPLELAVIYDSPRKLCPVLYGAFEGAAERYGERVQIAERTCMKRGAAVCRFELRFSPRISRPLDVQQTPEQAARQQAEQELEDLVLSVLPDRDIGVTLAKLQAMLRSWQIAPDQARPAVILKALNHLSFAGLVATSANEPGDTLATRRYWRAPTVVSHY